MGLIKVENILNTMGVALRSNRERAAKLIIYQPELLQPLFQLSLNPEFKNHHKGAWILEIILEQNLQLIGPHINFYCENLNKVKNPSAVRALSKINHWIAYDYIKNNSLNTKYLTKENIYQIVTVGFDRMIQDYPVATQVYTMDTLFYFGQLKKNGIGMGT